MRVTRDDDLMSAEITHDPYPYFREVRSTAPVHWNERHDAWVVTRHEDCVSALHDERLAADTFTPFYDEQLPPEARLKWRPMFEILTSWLAFMDPPDHTQFRRLFSRAFTPRVVHDMAGGVRDLAADLLGDAMSRNPVAFVDDFAYPFPAGVVGLMLGVPADDLWIVREWSDDIITIIQGKETPDRFQKAQTALLEFKEYLRALLEERRRAPVDPDGDLLARLIAVQRDDPDLTDHMILSSVIFLLVAGHETTQNSLQLALIHLLTHPDQVRLLREGQVPLNAAVEEVFRFDGPLKGTVRVARESIELAGQNIAPGDRVMAFLAAANRDPDVHARPEQFDITREVNQHLMFGHGIHFCIGAPLARLELETALELLLVRDDRPLRIASDVEFEPRLLARAPRTFTLEVG